MHSPGKIPSEHGGLIRRGRRKLARPLSRRHPLRIVLRSSRARGTWALDRARNRATIARLLPHCARKWHVRVLDFRLIPDRLELTVRFRSPEALRAFLREFPGRLALAVMRASKTRPQGRFWNSTAYSCILWRVVGLRFARERATTWERAPRARRGLPRTDSS